ncbi:hypothetical protein KV205_00160 [Streptomyces sp. SKN60]|uniref:hypothetical protein n=1 Tax=Streptomyces sp. SKN60 TaxID=2855506 RepID=UPI002247BEB6|nr:hypothetical protein [Streptomyces sp. SKN60]MCX2178960.1 hypothetical protein [Streptomyces sp. SKN60]
MSRARHRVRRPAPFMGPDRSCRNALTFLAIAGLAGPAWALRTQTGQLLDATGYRVAVAVPDTVLPPLATGR